MITVEEGSVGGFGSQVAQLLIDEGRFDRGFRFRSLTLPDVFVDHDKPEKMYAEAGLDARGIVRTALAALGRGELGVPTSSASRPAGQGEQP